MLSRDHFVAVVGALAVVVVLASLVVVEQRNGPFRHDLSSSAGEIDLQGTLTTTGPTTPIGTPCPQATVCSPPRTEVALHITGLAPLDGGGRYVAHLVGDGISIPLGPLSWAGQEHRLEYGQDQDGRETERLVISLSTGPSGPSPSPLVLVELPVPATSTTAELTAAVATQVGRPSGSVVVAQVGAVEVSATAEARVEGLVFHDGWAYRAWFIDEGGEQTYLGELTQARSGVGVLDSRVERVMLAQQEGFLITLAPAGSSPGVSPAGIPVAIAQL